MRLAEETEDLHLDAETVAKGVAAILSDTAKGLYYVAQVGNEIAIELIDDGGGINLEQIRANAVAQGRFGADATPTDAATTIPIHQWNRKGVDLGHHDLITLPIRSSLKHRTSRTFEVENPGDNEGDGKELSSRNPAQLTRLP